MEEGSGAEPRWPERFLLVFDGATPRAYAMPRGRAACALSPGGHIGEKRHEMVIRPALRVFTQRRERERGPGPGLPCMIIPDPASHTPVVIPLGSASR